MKYRKCYKYQLAETELYQTTIRGYEFDTEFIAIGKSGLLVIKSGYAWDGASGPTIDTDSSMRGSLIHDALYQLLRMKFLPQEFKEEADNILEKVCKEDGMWEFRADAWRLVVDKFADGASDPKNKKKIYEV